MSTRTVSPSLLAVLFQEVDQRNGSESEHEALKRAAVRHGVGLSTAWRALKLRNEDPELLSEVMAGRTAVNNAWRRKVRANSMKDAALAPTARKRVGGPRRHLQVLSGVEGAATAITKNCEQLNVGLALSAAELGHTQRLEKALRETVAALNHIRREIRAYEVED